LKRPGLKTQIEDAGNKIKYKDLPKIDIAQFFDLEYYVPSIEEFHPGFKYEHLSDGLFEDSIEDFWGWYNRCFGEDSFDIDIVIEEFKKESERFRVKYLDKEDIESTVFENWIDMEKRIGRSVLEPFPSFTFLSDDGQYKLKHFNDHDVRIYHNENTVFDGHVNNISELKIILKQIGVTE